jgi:hypothetical protein
MANASEQVTVLAVVIPSSQAEFVIFEELEALGIKPVVNPEITLPPESVHVPPLQV